MRLTALYLQSKEIDPHALSWITFEEDCIMTACKEGKLQSNSYNHMKERTTCEWKL